MRARRWGGTGLFVLVLLGACVGDDPGATSAEGDEAGANASSSSSGALVEGGAAAPDACVPGCSVDTFTSCSGPPVECPLGCVETGCRESDPPGSLTAADLRGLATDVDLGATFTADEAAIPLVIDTDTGRIVRPAVKRGGGLGELVVRAANVAPEIAEDVSGVRFELRDDLAVFSAKNFTLHNARIVGARPVAFVAAEQLHVLGRVEATCGLVGGFAGGLGPGQAGLGPGGGGGGKGSATAAASGGGGGGHGGAGGPGGTGIQGGAAIAAGAAGPAQGDLALVGGSGGGGAGLAATKQRGGAGGGVVVLVAGAGITLGDDLTTRWFPPEATAAADLSKGVDVSGCGGMGGPGSAKTSAAGGGAGGVVWIEAPVVGIRTSAGLAANGGSGGGTVAAGARGSLSEVPAPGGSGGGGFTCAIATGGAGAAAVQVTGGAGTRQAHPSCTDSDVGSGGGGGGGHLRIRTRTGGVEPFAGIASPKPLLQLGKL